MLFEPSLYYIKLLNDNNNAIVRNIIDYILDIEDITEFMNKQKTLSILVRD